jgi:hypothetical protein
MSPDGSQVLAQVNNDLYTATVPLTGDMTKISVANPDRASFPASKLTDIGGQFPAWSWDGRTVHWSIGNGHFMYNLDDAKERERQQEQYDEEQAAKLQKKISRDQFTFNDFLDQLKQIRKMGNIKDLMGMIPGMNKAVKDADIDDEQFDKLEAIILSMTPDERENPKLLNGSRRQRLAEGSGNSIQEVNQFIKQFDQMRKMMKKMQKMGGMAKAMRGGNMPFMQGR